MRLGKESLRVVIAGAASLRGADLKRWMEESAFPVGEIRLLDEEFAAGTLTDLAGEPAIIQPVDASSFDGMRFAFFAGTAKFAARHEAAAVAAGSTVIDLSGGLAVLPNTPSWIPRLDTLLPPPVASHGTGAQSKRWLAPSTPAIVACSLSAALTPLSLTRMVLLFFQPVSERGQAGVDELEAQTGKLLTLQPIPQKVFDTQVAFNLLDRWGAESAEKLSDARSALVAEVDHYLEGRTVVPAMTLIQAPVFYGHAFSCYAEFAAPQNPEAIAERLAAAGFAVAGDDDPAPSNASVAGEERPAIGRAERHPRGYWLWGAADNLRVATANATRIAESLLAS